VEVQQLAFNLTEKWTKLHQPAGKAA